MRKGDIEVGAEYAVGRSGRYAEWRSERAVVVEVGAERKTYRGWSTRPTVTKDGVRVRYLDRTGRRTTESEDGTEVITTREVRAPWAEYAKRKAERDEQEAAWKKHVAESHAKADRAAAALKRMGFKSARASYPFRVVLDSGDADRLVRAIGKLTDATDDLLDVLDQGTDR